MKTYNLLFENVEAALEYDIEKCVIHQFGFNCPDKADITYKISVKNSKLSIERQTQLTAIEIITDTHLWNEFIPFIPKRKGVAIVASSMDYHGVAFDLSMQLGYRLYPFIFLPDLIEKFPSNSYAVIGSDNLIEIASLLPSSVDLFTDNPDLLEHKVLNRFNSINILSPEIPTQLLKLPNVNILDITNLIVDRIYNNFYDIGV